MNPAKFLPPRPVRVFERDQLMNRLAAWEDKKLLLVHAQAGQGKSTLVASYIKSLASPSVWYNLDQEDENPGVFLSSLGKAVQQTWQDRLPTLPPVPQHRYGMGQIHQGLDQWVRLVFHNLPDTSLIVFDDFAGTPSGSLEQLLKMLLASTPPFVRFLVISRTRPELEIAKLRATQSVGELTGEDLRFSDAEVQDLFTIIFRMQISETEAALINATAEGWPAGLVLMHEYLSTLSPKARSLALIDRRSTGFRTHVFDYLAQEVFVHLPQELQQFLLRTSIADYLSAPLMAHLTGLPRTHAGRWKTSVAGMVKELRSRNLFVTAMDSDASVIRYHALFREFLRKKLVAQTKPSEVKKLYTAAATYFLKAGDVVRSIDLLIASGQFERAIRQIEQAGEDLIVRGQVRTLIRWIEALPLEYGNRPWFLFSRAVACRYTDPRTALAFFDLAFKGFRSSGAAYHRSAGQMLSLCGIIETCFYAGGNFKRMTRAAAMASALLKRTTQKSPDARSRLLLALGTACFFIGKLQQGAEALQGALDAFRRSRDHYHQIQSAIYLAPCAIYLGNFRLAREAIRKGFEAHASIPEESGGGAALSMAQAMTALFEGQFVEAQACIDKCQSLSQEHELEAFDFLSLDIGGWLKTALADYDHADQLLQQCKSKGEELQNAFFNASAAHLLAINYLHQNKLDAAQAEADYALAVRSLSGSSLFYALSLSVSGALELKHGRMQKAEQMLNEALSLFRRNGAAQQEANVLLLLAELSAQKKRGREFREFLHAGLAIGRERGFTYYALFTRADMENLVRRALAENICADYCETLQKKFREGTSASSIRICCFNGFKVFRDRERITDGLWKSTRAKALLKLLASRDGLTLPRDTALELLWPGDQPESPNQSLNSMLSRIRKVLEPATRDDGGDSCLSLKDGILMLDASRVWTDVGQFHAHIENAERMKVRGKTEQAIEEYSQAIMLYQGDFLPEDLSADWTAAVRDQLQTRYLRALEAMATMVEGTSDSEKTRAVYEKLFLADPCNENACCWLMTQYHSDGRRSDAIRAYERCELALGRDLDLEPEERTKKLYRGILGGD